MSTGEYPDQYYDEGTDDTFTAVGTLEDVRDQRGSDQRVDADSGIGYEPEGELQVPLESQVADLDKHERLRAALEGIRNPQE